MLSLANAFSDEELKAWEERAERLAGASVERSGFVAELKIDGAAVSLTYRDEGFVEALTRGNGRIGEAVTANLRTIRTVPLRLRTDKPPYLMEIRGEVAMPRPLRARTNEAQAAAGEPVFANPRNAALRRSANLIRR